MSTAAELITHFDHGLQDGEVRGYIRYCEDTVRKHATDDNESMYATHLIMSAIGTIFEHEFKEEPWSPSGDLITYDTSAKPGSRGVWWQTIERMGTAGRISGDGLDAPTAEVAGGLEVNRTDVIATKIGWNYMQMLEDGVAGGINRGTELGKAAREAWDRGMAQFVRNGESEMGWSGMLGLPHSINVQATTGDWLNASTTGQQMSADFRLATQTQYNVTNSVERANTAVIAGVLRGELMEKFMDPTNATISVFESLKNRHEEIDKWVFDPDLDIGDDQGADPTALIYNRDADKIRALMPMKFTPRPPQVTALRTETIFLSQFAGLAAPRPMGLVRLNNLGA